MPIRDCIVLAIDGTHASGKTTLLHALTAHYRRQGVNVAAMGEPARSSPFIEAIVLREAYQRTGVALVDVPKGLETDQRVQWIARRVDDSGLVIPR